MDLKFETPVNIILILSTTMKNIVSYKETFNIFLWVNVNVSLNVRLAFPKLVCKSVPVRRNKFPVLKEILGIFNIKTDSSYPFRLLLTVN